MTWVRTEDSMPLHPKILLLSDGAFRLWSNALAFANRATTDGRIEKALLPTLNHHGKWTKREITGFVSELVPGLWIDCGDHFQIHDYEHHQAEAMKERVDRKRAYERDKKRKQREEKDKTGAGTKPNVPTGQPTGHTPGGHGVSSVPTRPVPLSSLRSDSESPDTRLLVRQHFARWYEQAKATLWPTNQAKADDVRAVADWVDQMATRESLAAEAVVERVMRHFAADEFAKSAGSPWAHFAKNYANYWQPAKPRASKPANSNNTAIGRGRIAY